MARGSMVWWNGSIVPEEKARISLFTHGLHYGVGAFEGIRVYRQNDGGSAVFRLREHIERLFNSMKIVGFEIPYKVDELVQAAIDTTKACKFDECYLRPIVFTGNGPLGVDPGPNPPLDVAILVWEWGKYLGDRGVQEGARLKISSYLRPHVNSSLTKAKATGQYLTGVVAKREALAKGYDEALLLDTNGFLSEGSGENIFIVNKGVVKTTPLTSILAGITRATVIEHLRHKGITVEEQLFTRDEVYCADEVFLTGTAAEITPVQSVDDRKIGAGKPGPVTLQLFKEYNSMVRGDLPSYARGWLTPVR